MYTKSTQDQSYKMLHVIKPKGGGHNRATLVLSWMIYVFFATEKSITIHR